MRCEKNEQLGPHRVLSDQCPAQPASGSVSALCRASCVSAASGRINCKDPTRRYAPTDDMQLGGRLPRQAV
eukprot:5319030-Prymnesium_polylepis.1